MRVFIVTIMFLFSGFYCFSQSILWESTVPGLNNFPLIKDAEIGDDGTIYALGTTSGWTVLDTVPLEWLHFDTLGNLLNRRPILEDKYPINAVGSGLLKVPEEPNFIVYGWGLDSMDISSDFIAKIDTAGNRIWQYDTSYFGGFHSTMAAIVLKDKSVVSTGYIQNSGTGDDISAKRIDSLGNLLWEKTYAFPNSEQGHDITEMLDGSLVIAGDSDGDNLIMRIDFDGRLIKDTLYSPLFGDFRRIGINSSPLNKVYANGGYLDSGNPIGESSRFSDLILDYQIAFDPFSTDFRINSDFNIVVERISITPNHTGISIFSDTSEISTFIFPNPQNNIRAINDLLFIGNGQMIVSGSIGSGNSDHWLAKITGVGEEWIPDRCAYQPPRAGFDWEYNYPVLRLRDTSSGGLKYLDTIYTWQWTTSNGSSGTADSLQVFFDSTQSDSISIQLIAGNWYDCKDTVNATLIFGPTGLREVHDLDLKIWPNPVSDQLHISFNPSYCQALFELYDVQGSLRFKKVLSKSESTFRVQKLPSGLYIYKISTEAGVKRAKLVKQ